MANEIGNTELLATKQEVIAEVAQRILIDRSKWMGTVRDVSNRAVKGASSVSFPKYSSKFTTENRASATAGTNQNPAFAKDTMLLDIRAHIQWLVDADDAIESTLDVQRELIEHATLEHARDLDVRMNAVAEAAGIVTTTAGDISQDVVLEMQQTLLQNKADMDNMYMQVSPKQYAILLKIDPFTRFDARGASDRPLSTGVLGDIYGIKIVMNTTLGADQYFMYDSMGLAVGFQRQPQFAEDDRPEFGAGSKLQVLTQKYGLKALQVAVPNAFQADGTTALGAAESAFIVKDNN